MISPLRVSRRSWATNQGTAWHGPPSQILEANRLPEMSPQISQVTEMKHSGPLWALMGSAIWQDQPEQREPVPGETFFPRCSICCRTPKAGDRTPGPWWPQWVLSARRHFGHRPSPDQGTFWAACVSPHRVLHGVYRKQHSPSTWK